MKILTDAGGLDCCCEEPPDPTGACCLPDMSCADVTESQCNAMGGVFQGSGTVCANVDCTFPPCAPCTAPCANLLPTVSVSYTADHGMGTCEMSTSIPIVSIAPGCNWRCDFVSGCDPMSNICNITEISNHRIGRLVLFCDFVDDLWVVVATGCSVEFPSICVYSLAWGHVIDPAETCTPATGQYSFLGFSGSNPWTLADAGSCSVSI